MRELFKPFRLWAEKRAHDRKFDLSIGREPHQDARFLLASEKIEKLVREGRTPFRLGSMSIVSFSPEDMVRLYSRYQTPPIGIPHKGTVETSIQYRVPPKGFRPEDVVQVFETNGVRVFVNKSGEHRIGTGYLLTEDQANQVEARIKAEKTRLGLSS